jgi:hypothetical protein
MLFDGSGLLVRPHGAAHSAPWRSSVSSPATRRHGRDPSRAGAADSLEPSRTRPAPVSLAIDASGTLVQRSTHSGPACAAFAFIYKRHRSTRSAPRRASSVGVSCGIPTGRMRRAQLLGCVSSPRNPHDVLPASGERALAAPESVPLPWHMPATANHSCPRTAGLTGFLPPAPR